MFQLDFAHETQEAICVVLF